MGKNQSRRKKRMRKGKRRGSRRSQIEGKKNVRVGNKIIQKTYNKKREIIM